MSDRAVLSVEPPVSKSPRSPDRASAPNARSCHARIRYGYRRLWIVLKREGWEVGKHRFYRAGRSLPTDHLDKHKVRIGQPDA